MDYTLYITQHKNLFSYYFLKLDYCKYLIATDNRMLFEMILVSVTVLLRRKE